MIKMTFALGILQISSPVIAQVAEAIPDQANVIVPDLSGSRAPEVIKDGWKYFFFHKPQISYQEAFADFSDCYRFLALTGWGNVYMPRFVSWRAADVKIQRKITNYTPLGGLIISGIEGTLSRYDRQAKMRRCMETKDYRRYGVAETIWKETIDQPPSMAMAIQAKIASSALFNGEVPTK